MEKMTPENSHSVEKFGIFLAKLVPEPMKLKDVLSNLCQEDLAKFLEEVEALDSSVHSAEIANDARKKLFTEQSEHQEQELLALRSFHEFLEINHSMELLQSNFGKLAVDFFVTASEKRKATAENYDVVMKTLQKELVAARQAVADVKKKSEADPLTLSHKMQITHLENDLDALLDARATKRISKK